MIPHIHIVIRWIIATWLVMVGVVYGLAAIGATSSPPTRQWGWMASAIICVKVGMLVAKEKRLPF